MLKDMQQGCRESAFLGNLVWCYCAYARNHVLQKEPNYASKATVHESQRIRKHLGARGWMRTHAKFHAHVQESDTHPIHA